MVAVIDPQAGGRLTSLEFNGVQLLVTGNTNSDPLLWGSYPMAPYAGRVRNSELNWKNTHYQLPKNADPHSLHGVIFNSPWTVTQYSPTELMMRCDLSPHWPLGGFAEQKISVTPTSLWCDLSITATDISMPAQLGWHPWFKKPTHTHFSFGAMLERDATGIATNTRATIPLNGVDDCFVEPDLAPRITIDGITVDIDSDCSHWVIYDMPEHATCIEPQSGPPNQINDDPFVLSPHETLSRWMEIRVAD